jgi:hypothetical protein
MDGNQPTAAPAPSTQTLDGSPKQQEGWTRLLTLTVTLVLVAFVAIYAFDTRAQIAEWLRTNPSAWPRLIVAVILALLPAAICIAQTVTRKRLIAKLNSVNELDIGKTVYFNSAQKAFESIVPAAITNDYFVPLLINVLTNFLLFLMVFNGFTFGPLLDAQNLLLAGIIAPNTDPASLHVYQQGTFAVMGAAFLGNYVYTLSQLLSRVNNNDLFPISLHFYSSRAVIAMVTACIFRHTIKAFGAEGSDLILLLGFTAGLAPDLLIVALARRAFQYLKIWGSRGDAKSEDRPTSLALLQIDDLTRDKIDRLSELGIDSAHALSRQNPFIIWAKLPYDLGLIIDWIAQAQLYVIVRDKKLQALRDRLVTDIFDLRCRLSGEGATALLQAIGLGDNDRLALCTQIEADEAYNRLLQVRTALQPSAPIASATVQAALDDPSSNVSSLANATRAVSA